PLAGIIGQAMPLAALKGAWANKAAASIGDTAPAQRLQRMAHCLQQHMGAAALDTPAQRAHVLFQALAAGNATLDTLAAHLGLSPRSLRRFSQAQFGYGAKTLERILRLQRFLRQSRALPLHSLAMLAADAGYADQAHLSREARELAGMTASELRLEWGQ
ncbi:helix-turn-helix domain-containing protein, partial [Klebsiella pneumoniae]